LTLDGDHPISLQELRARHDAALPGAMSGA
jgi:hypothetical protein